MSQGTLLPQRDVGQYGCLHAGLTSAGMHRKGTARRKPIFVPSCARQSFTEHDECLEAGIAEQQIMDLPTGGLFCVKDIRLGRLALRRGTAAAAGELVAEMTQSTDAMDLHGPLALNQRIINAREQSPSDSGGPHLEYLRGLLASKEALAGYVQSPPGIGRSCEVVEPHLLPCPRIRHGLQSTPLGLSTSPLVCRARRHSPFCSGGAHGMDVAHCRGAGGRRHGLRIRRHAALFRFIMCRRVPRPLALACLQEARRASINIVHGNWSKYPIYAGMGLRQGCSAAPCDITVGATVLQDSMEGLHTQRVAQDRGIYIVNQSITDLALTDDTCFSPRLATTSIG